MQITIGNITRLSNETLEIDWTFPAQDIIDELLTYDDDVQECILLHEDTLIQQRLIEADEEMILFISDDYHFTERDNQILSRVTNQESLDDLGNLNETESYFGMSKSIIMDDSSYLKYILEHGSSPDICGNLNMSPLHWAAGLNRFDLLKLLIKNSNDINISSSLLWTPLDVAIENKSKEAISLLEKHGALCHPSGNILEEAIRIGILEEQEELSKEELLNIGTQVLNGERPESDLEKFGIEIGEPITGELAKEVFLKEIEEIEKEDR